MPFLVLNLDKRILSSEVVSILHHAIAQQRANQAPSEKEAPSHLEF